MAWNGSTLKHNNINSRSFNHIFIYCRGYTVRLFMTGDYEFLTRMYGLSGASGKPNRYMYIYFFLSINSRFLLQTYL